jgi:hypothetical protein
MPVIVTWRMDISFISSIAVIVADPAPSRKLFIDALGLPLQPHPGDEYYFSEKIAGARHFGVWPLSQAAEACFGTRNWPSERPTPQACLEFDVPSEAAVGAAAEELRSKGYALIHDARMEPWGQMVARLQMPEGPIIGISYAPWLHTTETPKTP